MTVRLYEWDKNETGWVGIEITPNKVVNLILRELNNLIKVNEDNEVYTDLQLEDWIDATDTLPVGVLTGRVLQADGWLTTGTLLVAKTTSGDQITILYGDNGELYIDNGTGTFTQIYLAPEIDALLQGLREELATVAFTGDYDDLINKPHLWTAASKDVWVTRDTVPILDQNGKLDPRVIPAMAFMNIYTVTTSADLTTLTNAHTGDIAVVTSENKTYILSGEPATTASNWTELLFPTGAVSSVNGYTGAVTLTTNDIAEANDKLYVSSAEKAARDAKLDQGDLATVAFSWSYTDLTNKPTVDSALNTSSTNAIQNWVVATAINSINGDISALQNAIGTAAGDIITIQGDITNLQADVSWKQDTLVSGTNIKTINNESILGAGNIDLQEPLVSGTNIKTINNQSILGSGNLDISSTVLQYCSLGSFLRLCKNNWTSHSVSVQNQGSTTYTFQGLGFIKVTQYYWYALKINGVTMFSHSFNGGSYDMTSPDTVYTMWPGDTVEIYRPGSSWQIWASITDRY